MKKTLKVLAVVAFVLAVLFILTGCGNKLVATKTTDEDGVKYKEKVEVSFKKDKINKVKATYTFDKKEDAEKYEKSYNALLALAGDEDLGIKLKRSGKKITINFDAKAFTGSEDNDMTKDEVKEMLEEEGYKVK